MEKIEWGVESGIQKGFKIHKDIMMVFVFIVHLFSYFYFFILRFIYFCLQEAKWVYMHVYICVCV